MKRFLQIITVALSLYLLPAQVLAADALIPGGQVLGFELENNTVSVAEVPDQSELKVGDILLKVNEIPISCKEDVQNALASSGSSVQVVVERNGVEKTLTLHPTATALGPKLGISLRSGMTGVGTLTWFDPKTGTFGALGHGVNDARGGLLQMESGTVYNAQIIGVKKGACGEPGQLRGAAQTLIGTLYANTSQGVFGTLPSVNGQEALPVGETAHTGKATIRSTVSGKEAKDYSVEILKVYPETKDNSRNILLKVTDSDLLKITGGIVQGMSGSPILQDGKLVGAVTHVLVEDPTKGYGIFIRNMEQAAEQAS